MAQKKSISEAITAPVDLPSNILCEIGRFENDQGVKLATYRFDNTNEPPKGVVYLAHGYGAHTFFDWLVPKSPGMMHDTYSGSVVEGLINAGFAIRALDHTGHGRSEGTRCYFHSFDHLVLEATSYIEKIVRKEPGFEHLPCYLFGLSMGGATVLKMAMHSPQAYKGIILYAPMISLEEVRRQPVLGCLRNAHLEPMAGCLSWLVPYLPIAQPARNEHNPLAQREIDEDPLTVFGPARARVAYEFVNVTRDFMDGGLSAITIPFVTYHGTRDTFTDPQGSEALFKLASVEDKTYLKVGPGADVDIDMWHALSAEPGREIVFASVREWLLQRI